MKLFKLHNETILSHMGLGDIELAARFQRWCSENGIPKKVSAAMFVCDHDLMTHYYKDQQKCLEAIGDYWSKLPKRIEL